MSKEFKDIIQGVAGMVFFGLFLAAIYSIDSFYPDFKMTFKIIFTFLLVAVGIGVIYYVFILPKQEEWREQSEKNKLQKEINKQEADEERRQDKAGQYEWYKEVLRPQIEAMPKYAKWKQAVFQKFGTICEVCGSVSSLEIHHKKSFHSIIRKYNVVDTITALECDAVWNVDNGSVMCRECHKKTDSHIENISSRY